MWKHISSVVQEKRALINSRRARFLDSIPMSVSTIVETDIFL